MIFIDTSAWVAIGDKRDINHASAIRFKEKLIASKERLLTSNFILDETYTLLLFDLGYERTINFKYQIDEMVSSHLLVIVEVTSEIEKQAWKSFERFNEDKTWSFTDCTSKVIMEWFQLTHAFTFDHHFEQMGFIKEP